jgi:HEAT repeat protein
MKKDPLKAKLAALHALRTEFDPPSALPLLRKSLADASNFVVAKAAQIAGEASRAELIPELLAAFDRLLDDVERDPGCEGKTALARTLKDLEYDEPAAFLRGLAHVQMEAVWGKRIDTAGMLRGTCAQALVACDIDPALLLERLTDHLVDSDKAVRIEVATAIAQLGRPESALLLRLKALSGDLEAEVVGTCLVSLLALNPTESVGFVARFLSGTHDDVRFEAASALAQAKSPDALAFIEDFWTGPWSADLRTATITALGGSPNPSVCDFLLRIVAQEPNDLAATALSALASSRFAADAAERAASIVRKRDEPALTRIYAEHFSRVAIS